MSTTITGVVARDIRFPTSENLDGSDAMNQAPDCSAAYLILETDSPKGTVSPSPLVEATSWASPP